MSRSIENSSLLWNATQNTKFETRLHKAIFNNVRTNIPPLTTKNDMRHDIAETASVTKYFAILFAYIDGGFWKPYLKTAYGSYHKLVNKRAINVANKMPNKPQYVPNSTEKAMFRMPVKN